jgi:hypothetical protein
MPLFFTLFVSSETYCVSRRAHSTIFTAEVSRGITFALILIHNFSKIAWVPTHSKYVGTVRYLFIIVKTTFCHKIGKVPKI